MRLAPFVNAAMAAVLVTNGGAPASGSDRADSPSPARVIDLEHDAVALAASITGVLVDEAGSGCPADRLRVSWTEPGPWYEVGAYVAPLGPPPTSATTRVNGLVLCEGSTYSYMGFEAARVKGVWIVEATPAISEDDGAGLNLDAEPTASDAPADPALSPPGRVASATDALASPIATAPATAFPPPADAGAGIDGYPAYEPQSSCDAVAKPGVLAVRDLLLATYPGTRNLGIVRGCSVGGRSEHKEGRAFDWGVNVNRPAEKQAADEFIGRLLATDERGNPHALARRLGVMYIIWNQQIWSAHRHVDGWRPYHGASAHTDHVHISFGWAGARAQTSYWSGVPVPTGIDESTPSPFREAHGGGGGSGNKPASEPKPRHERTPEEVAAWEATKQRRAAEEASRRAEREAQRQRQVEEEARRRAEREAERQRRLEAERLRRSTTTTTKPKPTTTTTRPRWRATTTTTRPSTTTTNPSTSSSTTIASTSPSTTTTAPPTTTSMAPPTTITSAPAPTTSVP